MSDIQEEREAFELNVNPVTWERIEYNAENNIYMAKSKYWTSTIVQAIANEIDFGWKMWQLAKAKAVPEGFVEKTESNTHHYFKLKDWDEWTCIDGIEDAITSDHDINAIVEVDCLEVIEISNKPCFALLASGKRHGTEVKFFDTEEEAIEAMEPENE